MSRAWSSLAEAWREPCTRASGALTRFRREREDAALAAMPRRGLLAGEVCEPDGEIVVRLEVPGLDPGDVHVRVEGDWLRISSEKRHEREARTTHCFVRERACARFDRAIPLPEGVDAGRARATCRHGVLTARPPKVRAAPGRHITVH